MPIRDQRTQPAHPRSAHSDPAHAGRGGPSRVTLSLLTFLLAGISAGALYEGHRITFAVATIATMVCWLATDFFHWEQRHYSATSHGASSGKAGKSQLHAEPIRLGSTCVPGRQLDVRRGDREGQQIAPYGAPLSRARQR